MVAKRLIPRNIAAMNANIDTSDRADPVFVTRIASTADDIRAAQRLRYAVFIEELGGAGPLVDHSARLDRRNTRAC